MELLAIVVVWVFGSLMAGKLAERKGLRGQTYILISMLLSPLVGLLAAAVAAPDERAVERARLASGTERKCPSCAEVVKAEAKVCRFCQRELPEPEPFDDERRFKSKADYEAWKARNPTPPAAASRPSR